MVIYAIWLHMIIIGQNCYARSVISHCFPRGDAGGFFWYKSGVRTPRESAMFRGWDLKKVHDII